MFYLRLKFISIFFTSFACCWSTAMSALLPLTGKDLHVVDEAVFEFILPHIYFKPFSASQNFDLSFFGLDVPMQRRLADVSNEVLRRAPKIPFRIGERNHVRRARRFFLHLIFVDDVKSFESFTKNYGVVPKKSPNMRYLIIIVPRITSGSAPPQNGMNRIFGFFYKKLLLDVNIAFIAPNDDVQVYTYFPYLPKACGATKPQLIHVHQRGAPLPDIMYPRKNHNFNGCPVRVATSHLPPYVELRPIENGEFELSGIEGRIVTTISRKLNFSIELVLTSSDKRGNVLRNGIVTGLYEILQKGQADISIGDCGCYPSRMRVLTASSAFYQSSLSIVAKRGTSYSSFEVVFYPFTSNIWCIMIIGVMMRYLLKWKVARLRMFPKQFRRFMFVMWLILCFFYRCGYDSFFFKFMRENPERPVPDTLEEFARRGYRIIADSNSDSLLQWEDRMRKIVTVMPIQSFETFQLLRNSSGYQLAALAKREYWAYFLGLVQVGRNNFYVANEKIVNEMLCFYFQRNSHLVTPFDAILQEIRTSGLIFKFVRSHVDLRAFYQLRIGTAHNDDLQFPLTKMIGVKMSQLDGVFWIMGLMWLIGLALLICEYLSLKCSALRWLLDNIYYS